MKSVWLHGLRYMRLYVLMTKKYLKNELLMPFFFFFLWWQ